MLEKIRVSLWDIFTFFLTGFFSAIIAVIFLLLTHQLRFEGLLSLLNALNASLMLVVAPLIFTLTGMLIEPFANYFDKFVIHPVYKKIGLANTKHSAEESLLAAEISANYLGSLNGKVSNPYAICKEYVETKQLSTTFMTFLARYGFYRNCAFLTFMSAVFAIRILPPNCLSTGIVLFLIIAMIIFKKRAEDFYSYMAPTVYRAFLIDKNKWVNP